MTKNSKQRLFRVTSSLKKIGRAVGRHSKAGIVNQVVKDKVMMRKLVVKMGKELKKELKLTCSHESKSLLKNKSLQAIESFSWLDVVQDLRRTAPLLFSLLFTLTSSSTKTKATINSLDKKQEIPIAFCAGILLRFTSQKANLIQRIISVLLYASHVPKQVRAYIDIINAYNIIIAFYKATKSWIMPLS